MSSGTGTLPPQTHELFQRVVSRERWKAQDMVRRGRKLLPPCHNVLMTYTGGERCDTLGECSRAVMELQRYHVRYHLRDDIPYSFVLGGDNRIYNGRTWMWVVPMPPEFEGKHRDTIVIARIGPKQDDPQQQEKDFLAGHDLCEWARDFKLLSDDYKVYMMPNDWNVYDNDDPDV